MVTTVVAKKSEFEKLQLGFDAAVLSLLIFSNLVSRFFSDSVFRPFATSLPSKSGGKIFFPMEVSFKVCKNKLTSSTVLCFVLGLYSIDSKMRPPRYRKTRFAKNKTMGTRFFLCVGVNFMAWRSKALPCSRTVFLRVIQITLLEHLPWKMRRSYNYIFALNYLFLLTIILIESLIGWSSSLVSATISIAFILLICQAKQQKQKQTIVRERANSESWKNKRKYGRREKRCYKSTCYSFRSVRRNNFFCPRHVDQFRLYK